MVKIRLSLLNSDSSCADITNEDGDSVQLVSIKSKNARVICRKAAEKLRKLALKFEALADDEEPFKVITQKRVNRMHRV